jgi:hypothetical protein
MGVRRAYAADHLRVERLVEDLIFERSPAEHSIALSTEIAR